MESCESCPKPLVLRQLKDFIFQVKVSAPYFWTLQPQINSQLFVFFQLNPKLTQTPQLGAQGASWVPHEKQFLLIHSMEPEMDSKNSFTLPKNVIGLIYVKCILKKTFTAFDAQGTCPVLSDIADQKIWSS